MTLGTVKMPTLEQFLEVAEDLGFSMSHEDLEAHLGGARAGGRGLQHRRPAA